MNRQALVCRNILEKPDITQREMAKNMDISLGTVNGLVKECLAEGYIAEEENGKEKYLILLEKGKELLKPYKVDGALIIAAGFTGPEKQIQEAFEAEFSKDSYQTNIENVFACGDCRTGQSLVVKAMVDGQKCAEAVEKYLAK